MKAHSDIELSARLDDAGRNQKLEFLGEVIKLISDNKSLLMIKTIFLASRESGENLRTQLNLTKKQYYSRISRLTTLFSKQTKVKIFCYGIWQGDL